MKSIIVAIFTILTYNIYGQNIYTVNPNQNSIADFSSFNDALAAANSGDILLLHGGDYGGVQLTKQLVIYGPGYFLNQNQETQSNASSAYFDYISIESSSNGSKIAGLECTNMTVVADNIELNNIKQTITSNSGNFYLQGDNIKVKKSYIELFGVASNSNNIVLENNYIRDFNTAISNAENIDLSLKNCVIERYGASTVLISIEGSIMQNNIFLEEELNINFFDNNSNLITNNIFVADLSALNANQDLINNNIHNVSIDSIFVDLAGNFADGQWQLASDSPAIGTGSDGTDIGMFGGSNPYVLSGIPSIPNIHFLEVNDVGSSQGGLEVTIKVNANN